MTKQTEALKMAHKSFMQLNERHPRRDNGDGYFDKEIQACKDALEQPAQEPVAYIKQGMDGYFKLIFNGNFKYKSIAAKWDDIALYTHLTPPWQGLSDDEKLAIIRKWKDAHTMREQELIGLGDAIEQALKEKNL
jgi:hypothetical protein